VYNYTWFKIRTSRPLPHFHSFHSRIFSVFCIWFSFLQLLTVRTAFSWWEAWDPAMGTWGVTR